MNCKQGDLAVVVAVTDERATVCIGWIVRCLWSEVDWNGRLGWHTDPKPPTGRLGFYDDALRPIRDPGDHATDETLGWKRVPSAHNLKEAA